MRGTNVKVMKVGGVELRRATRHSSARVERSKREGTDGRFSEGVERRLDAIRDGLTGDWKPWRRSEVVVRCCLARHLLGESDFAALVHPHLRLCGGRRDRAIRLRQPTRAGEEVPEDDDPASSMYESSSVDTPIVSCACF